MGRTITGKAALNVKQWENLFQGFSQKQKAKRERSDITRELVAWYDEQTHLVMTLVREVISERAAAFVDSSGVEIDVQWPSHPPINLDPDGPFMSFMCLRVPERELHMYSHRVALTPPVIHFVIAGPQLHKRLVARSGCRIEKRDGGGFALRSVDPSVGQGILSVDDLAYRAFELLLADS
jgi:hypothetical protein